jgi:hypothetical protein
MNCAQERKYSGIAGTVSISKRPDKVIIEDEDKIPKQFLKTTTTPDKTAINKIIKAGGTVVGVKVEDGGEGITIRVK